MAPIVKPKVFKVVPTRNGILLRPVPVAVDASGVPVPLDIKPINSNTASGIVIEPVPTCTGNILAGTVVFYPAAAGVPFLDGPNNAEIIVINENDIVAIKKEIIVIDPRNLGAMNPNLGKPKGQYE